MIEHEQKLEDNLHHTIELTPKDQHIYEPGLSVHGFEPQLLPAVAEHSELLIDSLSLIIRDRRLLQQATSIMQNTTDVSLLVCQSHHELLQNTVIISNLYTILHCGTSKKQQKQMYLR